MDKLYAEKLERNRAVIRYRKKQKEREEVAGKTIIPRLARTTFILTVSVSCAMALSEWLDCIKYSKTYEPFMSIRAALIIWTIFGLIMSALSFTAILQVRKYMKEFELPPLEDTQESRAAIDEKLTEKNDQQLLRRRNLLYLKIFGAGEAVLLILYLILK